MIGIRCDKLEREKETYCLSIAKVSMLPVEVYSAQLGRLAQKGCLYFQQKNLFS